jgi:hypothetical protein
MFFIREKMEEWIVNDRKTIGSGGEYLTMHWERSENGGKYIQDHRNYPAGNP